jgi:hypothetical protein
VIGPSHKWNLAEVRRNASTCAQAVVLLVARSFAFTAIRNNSDYRGRTSCKVGLSVSCSVTDYLEKDYRKPMPSMIAYGITARIVLNGKTCRIAKRKVR